MIRVPGFLHLQQRHLLEVPLDLGMDLRLDYRSDKTSLRWCLVLWARRVARFVGHEPSWASCLQTPEGSEDGQHLG